MTLIADDDRELWRDCANAAWARNGLLSRASTLYLADGIKRLLEENQQLREAADVREIRRSADRPPEPLLTEFPPPDPRSLKDRIQGASNG